ADDFMVEAGTEFTLQQIRLNLLSTSAITNATFKILNDNGGAPGADVLHTITQAPTTSRIVGMFMGFDNYEVTFDLDSPITLEEGTYWLQPLITNASNNAVYWESTETGSHGSNMYWSDDSGVTWFMDPDYQQIFFVAGECEEIVQPEGCLDTPNGQYPSGSGFTPTCTGLPESITPAGWTGEYSLVNVRAGTDYVFSSSVNTDYITISN